VEVLNDAEGTVADAPVERSSVFAPPGWDGHSDPAVQEFLKGMRREYVGQAQARGRSKVNPDAEFLQALRPADVVHVREQLLRWWSVPGEWQHRFALQGRRPIEGFTPPPMAEDAENARGWMARAFRNAELYWVSPEMTDVIAQLAPSIPDCRPQPPVETAFVMFAKPIPGTDADTGSRIFTSAFLWQELVVAHAGPCIALETYSWRDLVSIYVDMDPKSQEAFRKVMPCRLMPTGAAEWPINSDTSDFSRLPADEPQMEVSMLEDRRLLSTFWALASQRMTIETREQPSSRQARRQAERQGHTLPEVRVIRLREPATRSRGDAGSDVEWSHRWLVGAHWRNQWYPTSGQHRPKLIEAYQKGPADKPLLVRDTVRALVR
jgi:hypothetical protein